MFAVFLLYSAVFPIVQMCLELSRGSLTWSLASILSGMYELLHAHTPHALSSTLKALDRGDSKDPPPPSFSTEQRALAHLLPMRVPNASTPGLGLLFRAGASPPPVWLGASPCQRV